MMWLDYLMDYSRGYPRGLQMVTPFVE